MMKIRKYIYVGLIGLSACGLASCNDDLEMRPESKVTPDNYLWTESQLGDYTVKRYDYISIDGEKGVFGRDNATDVQAGKNIPDEFITDQYKVSLKEGDWESKEIYNINYFLNTVMPRFHAKKLTGDEAMIKHYIGEIYFFRALQYFNKLKAVGDFPILKTNLPDNKEALIAASKRMPRTEVARFILADLDSAIMMMKPESPDKGRNRLSKPVAQLMKSRVALREATWLKYFKGTPFVPNAEGWPGATKDYNQNYQFQSGSIDNEINWFLDQAIEAADVVASTIGLTENTGILPQGPGELNPFVSMYNDISLSGYKEVLLWKCYDRGLGVTNNVPVNASSANMAIGITRGMVNNFLMENGLPYYAPGSEYAGDESIGDVRTRRDQRCMLFLKEPKQKNMWFNLDRGDHGVIEEPILPNITHGADQFRYNTGYTSRKGVHPDKALCDNWYGYNGIIVYRSAEAYLNYMEAYYERHGNLDTKALTYWKALRKRAGVSENIEATINATQMDLEAQFNWSAYSAGQIIDKTLYNIRRERACELLGEGYRKDDLKRWRSMDQLIEHPFHIEGFKVWGDYYRAEYAREAVTNETYALIYGVDNEKANVSSPELSLYLRPYEIVKTLAYNGFTWHLAHYLNPIAIQHFRITSGGAEGYTDSPIYQNPHWPTVADSPALK